VDEIPDGGSKGFAALSRLHAGLFAVRRGAQIRVYVNSCPHLEVGLDWVEDKFLSTDGSVIVCAMHGALFQIDDGLCTFGPCYGSRLEVVKIDVIGGAVFVPDDAGL
jgi:nitrite reductase/ring-hydroxylating ferredoxin subunit